MKKTTLIMFAGMLLFCSAASAQFILGVEGSYLTGATGNKNSQWGFGIQGKGKISNMVAVGATARTYLKNFHEYESAPYSTRSADALTQLAGLLEVYFGKSAVQPYIGTDVGVYFANTVIQSNTSSSNKVDIKNSKTYFGVGPKVGIQFNTGSISPFVQGQYHVLFGGGEDIEVPGFSDVVRTHDKFWTIDAGILFQIGKVGDK